MFPHRHVTPGTSELHPGMPSWARVIDALAGGKDTFAPDREVAGLLTGRMAAGVEQSARFMGRAVEAMAKEWGLRQYLIVGAGFPTATGNPDEIATSVHPEARTVYVDPDVQLSMHRMALRHSATDGQISHVHADPVTGFDAMMGKVGLDLLEPVGVFVGLLSYMPEAAGVALVDQLTELLPTGSGIAVTFVSGELDEDAELWNEKVEAPKMHTMKPARVRGWFDGLGYDIATPGVVRVTEWRPPYHVAPALAVGHWGALCAKGRVPASS